MPARLVRPASDTDEGGLWALMDREERRLRRSPLLVRDAALRDYLQELVCRLAGEHCADIRVHVVRTAQFNASIAPNGMVQVWSGLLLRVDNEAQLAAVLAHELAHYLERHALEMLREVRAKSAAAALLSMFGVVGMLAGLGVAATVHAFSREQEHRADALGMHLLRRAGYEPREFPRIWDNLLAELKAGGDENVGRRSVLFASHPPAGERREALLASAGGAGGRVGTAALARVVAPFRMDWLHDEIQRGQYGESLALFNRKLSQHEGDAQWLYARAEVLRLRQPPDLAAALQDLELGAKAVQPPPELFRSLGLVRKQRQERAAAIEAFRTYLELAPQAADARLITSYMTELQ